MRASTRGELSVEMVREFAELAERFCSAIDTVEELLGLISFDRSTFSFRSLTQRH
jgi:hypothetical protein